MHHKHIFLSNEETPEEAMAWTESILTDGTLAYGACDYATVLGAIDLEKDIFIESGNGDYSPAMQKVAQLEMFVNTLFGESKLTELQQRLDYNLKNHLYWQASQICKEIDGIYYATNMGCKWTAKQPFPVCDGYIDMCGVTDWCDCTSVGSKNKAKYAVIVDFHS